MTVLDKIKAFFKRLELELCFQAKGTEKKAAKTPKRRRTKET